MALQQIRAVASFDARPPRRRPCPLAQPIIIIIVVVVVIRRSLSCVALFASLVQRREIRGTDGASWRE